MADKTVFDLDALAAEKREEPFRFRFGGDDYQLAARMDVRAVAAFQEGNLAAALRIMLGEEQWDRMQRSPAVFDEQALLALLEAHAAHAGTSLGESAASTGS